MYELTLTVVWGQNILTLFCTAMPGIKQAQILFSACLFYYIYLMSSNNKNFSPSVNDAKMILKTNHAEQIFLFACKQTICFVLKLSW